MHNHFKEGNRYLHFVGYLILNDEISTDFHPLLRNSVVKIQYRVEIGMAFLNPNFTLLCILSTNFVAKSSEC